MEIGASLKEPDLGAVAPSTVVIANVQGLMEIAHQIKCEPEGLLSLFPRLRLTFSTRLDSANLETTQPPFGQNSA